MDWDSFEDLRSYGEAELHGSSCVPWSLTTSSAGMWNFTQERKGEAREMWRKRAREGEQEGARWGEHLELISQGATRTPGLMLVLTGIPGDVAIVCFRIASGLLASGWGNANADRDQILPQLRMEDHPWAPSQKTSLFWNKYLLGVDAVRDCSVQMHRTLSLCWLAAEDVRFCLFLHNQPIPERTLKKSFHSPLLTGGWL